MKRRTHTPSKGMFWQVLSALGVTVTVREALDMDLDGFSREELLLILEDLYEKRTKLYFREPIGESTDAYARWDDQLFTLQDQISQVEDALELAGAEPAEEETYLWATALPLFRAVAMQ